MANHLDYVNTRTLESHRQAIYATFLAGAVDILDLSFPHNLDPHHRVESALDISTYIEHLTGPR